MALPAVSRESPFIIAATIKPKATEHPAIVHETLDKQLALRSTIATLQDLGFFIDNADLELGTVTATRHSGQTMRMTVTARERAGQRVVVRANARVGETGISEMNTYQDFFVALDKAIFLTRNDVD